MLRIPSMDTWGNCYSLTPKFGCLRKFNMRLLIMAFISFLLASCSTAIAVADAAGTAVVYSVKTVVNTVDAITPDIVNKKKKD
jgi:hypothetical protein